MLPLRRHWHCVWIASLSLVAATGQAESSRKSALAYPLSQSGAVQGQAAGTESSLPVFEVHSGFWLNLHHFLYLQARLRKGSPSAGESARGAAQPDELPVSLADYPAAEIRAWNNAVQIYSKDLASRDLLLNGDMEIINNQLAAMETCPDLEGKASAACKSGLRPDLVEALESAAPVYRAHWWAQQDRANREWIAQVAPMIRQMGVALSGQLAEVYQRPWPPERVRVDLAWYAGPYGAYTTLSPAHVTISSHDPRNRGVYGFEVLFHEASHALASAVNEAIAREFRDRDKPIPRDLWHALLFYTTGELVRRDLERGTITLALDQNLAGLQAEPGTGKGTSGYLPYAARFGLYSGSWERFRGLLDLYWMPYLDGRVSFDTAIARLAGEM